MPKQTSISSFFTKSPGPGKTKEKESPRGQIKLRGNELQQMDLVWAKMEGHPWWPAMVCNSPGEDTFMRRNQIHVHFFDKPPSRGWVKEGLIKPYGSAVASGVPSYRDATWLEAVKEAEKVEQLPRDDRFVLVVDMLPTDDEDEVMDEDEDDSDKSKENVAVRGVNGHARSGGKASKEEPKAKRRRIILHSDSESEDDYKPDESGESDDSISSGVDEAMVSGPETESEVDSPVKVYGAQQHITTGKTPALRDEASKVLDPGSANVASCRDIMQRERMMEAWVLDQVRRGCPPSMDTLRKKAEELLQDRIDLSTEWFEGLAIRCCLDTAQNELNKDKGQGQGHNVNQNVVRQMVQDLVKEGNYSAKQVFVVGESGQWWGCLSRKDNAKSDHRLTLLLCFNAAGDCRLKPLVVGHQSRPSDLKDTRMSSLPVVWRSNRRAKVTSVLFDDWFVNHFVPAVQEHCRNNGLVEQGLLLVANTPGRPSHLLNHPTVKMAYLPCNSPWPLGYGVADALGRHFFRLGIEAGGRGRCGISLWDLWKEVDLKLALRNIAVSWSLLAQETLNRAWSGMWPEAVRYTCATPEAPAKDIVALIKDSNIKELNEVVLEALVWACQEELSEKMLNQVVKRPMCLEDEGLEEPVPGLLALTRWDLRDILQHINDACTLMEGQEGSQELCKQLKEASKEYQSLLMSADHLEMTDPSLLPIKKEEVEIGEETYTFEPL